MENIFVIGSIGLGLDMKTPTLSLLTLGLFYWSLCFVWGHSFPLRKSVPFFLPYNGAHVANTLSHKARLCWVLYNKHDAHNNSLQ